MIVLSEAPQELPPDPVAEAVAALIGAASASSVAYTASDLREMVEIEAEVAALSALDESAHYTIGGGVRFDREEAAATIAKFKEEAAAVRTEEEAARLRKKVAGKVRQNLSRLGAELKHANGWARGIGAFALGMVAGFGVNIVAMTFAAAGPIGNIVAWATLIGLMVRKYRQDVEKAKEEIEKAKHGGSTLVFSAKAKEIKAHIEQLEEIGKSIKAHA